MMEPDEPLEDGELRQHQEPADAETRIAYETASHAAQRFENVGHPSPRVLVIAYGLDRVPNAVFAASELTDPVELVAVLSEFTAAVERTVSGGDSE